MGFQPKVGRATGGEYNILNLVGQVNDNHVSSTAEWTGPGRLRVAIDAPSGAGEFHGECFNQSYTARVAVAAIKRDRPALPDDRLQPGDQLITGPGGETVVQLPDCSKLLVKPNSVITFTSPGPGLVQVEVVRGGFRMQRPPGGPHGLWVKMGSARAVPVGTELEVLSNGETGTITVIDGTVNVTPEEGAAEIPVTAGQLAEWPGWQTQALRGCGGFDQGRAGRRRPAAGPASRRRRRARAVRRQDGQFRR